MSNITTNTSDNEMIEKTVQFYIDGAKSGKGDDMKPAFHTDATIFGYAGDELFAGHWRRAKKHKLCALSALALQPSTGQSRYYFR